MLETGAQIEGYRIDALLGSGGMAEVYRAWQPNLQRHEALKVLLPHMAHDQLLVDRFLNEARTVAKLQHPNIAAVYTVSGTGASQPFFTMELVEGGDLAKLIHSRGQLSLEETLPILRQIAAALDFAHSHSLIHRDIKPANILLQQGTNGFVAKVVDFGISKAMDDANGAHLTRTGTFVGTPEYMSPEQAGSGDALDQRTDQYSLAILAYEMLCGVPPFRQEGDTTMMSVLMKHVREQPLPPSRHNQDLSASVDAAILRALAKHPAQRFSSCEEFVNALTTYQAPPAPPLPPESGTEHTKSTFPKAAAAVVLTIIMGVVLIIVGAMNNPRNESNSYGEISNMASSEIADNEPLIQPSPPQVTVPYMVGKSESEAKSSLQNNAFAVKKVEGYSNNYAAGQVMSQFPKGGKAVEQGTTVTIRVSQGAVPEAASNNSIVPHTSEVTRWATYTNNEGGWALEYPAGWSWTTKHYNEDNRTRVEFTGDSSNVSFLVDYIPSTSGLTPLEDWQNMHSRYQRAYKDRYQLLHLSEDPLGGQPGARWEFKLRDKKGLRFRKIDRGANYNGSSYALLFTAPEDEFLDASTDIFNHVYLNFRFIE